MKTLSLPVAAGVAAVTLSVGFLTVSATNQGAENKTCVKASSSEACATTGGVDVADGATQALEAAMGTASESLADAVEAADKEVGAVRLLISRLPGEAQAQRDAALAALDELHAKLLAAPETAEETLKDVGSLLRETTDAEKIRQQVIARLKAQQEAVDGAFVRAGGTLDATFTAAQAKLDEAFATAQAKLADAQGEVSNAFDRAVAATNTAFDQYGYATGKVAAERDNVNETTGELGGVVKDGQAGATSTAEERKDEAGSSLTTAVTDAQDGVTTGVTDAAESLTGGAKDAGAGLTGGAEGVVQAGQGLAGDAGQIGGDVIDGTTGIVQDDVNAATTTTLPPLVGRLAP